MKRNLVNRVETVMPVEDPELKQQLDRIHAVYEEDNCSVWDCHPDGTYVLRTPAEGDRRREAQVEFIRRAKTGLETRSPSGPVRQRRPA